MERRHLIDEIVFDISFDAQAQVFEHQDDIRTFVCDTLLPVIDKVCSSHSDQDSVLRVGSMEIDLGDVPVEDFEIEMCRRLRDKLSELLSGIRRSAAAANATQAERVSRRQAELEQLEYFLLHGSMPWHADAKDGLAHERIMDSVLRENGAELAALLKRAPLAQRGRFIERLVRQFPERHLAAVLKQLEPSQADTLLGTISDMRKVLAETSHAPAEAFRLLWEQAMLGASEISGKSLGGEMLVDAAVKRIALAQGEKPDRIFASIADVAQRLAQEKKIGSGLIELLETMQRRGDMFEDEVQVSQAPVDERAGVSIAGKEKDSTKPERSVSGLEQRLVHALLRGDASGIKSDWASLVREHPEMLKAALRRYGARTDTLSRLIAGFPESMLIDLVRVSAPEAAGMIAPLLDTEAFWQAAGGEQRIARQRVWEFVLGRASTMREGEIVPRSYAQDLLKHVTQDDRGRMADLTLAWREAVEDVPQAVEALDEVMSSLPATSLPMRPAVPEEEGSADNAQRSEAIVRGYDLYETLRRVLWKSDEETASKEEALLAAINELAGRHAMQLRRFFRELRDMAPQALHAIPLTGAIWQRLVQAFIEQMPSSSEGDRQAFVVSIDEQARRAEDRAAYFRRILHGLLHDLPLDLEAIVEGSAAKNEGAVSDGLSSVDVGARRERKNEGAEPIDGISSSKEEEAAHAFTGSDAPPDIGEQESRRHAVDALLGEHSAWFTGMEAPLGAEEKEKLRDALEKLLEKQSIPLTGLTWQWVVQTFIDQMPSSSESDRQAFLASVNERARRAKDQAAYFQQILHCLLQDLPLDLEVIVERTWTKNEAATAEGMPSADAGARPEYKIEGTDSAEVAPLSQEEAVSRAVMHSETPPAIEEREVASPSREEVVLRTFMRSEALPHAEEREALRHAMEVLLEKRPPALKIWFEQSLQTARQAARLTQALPERLLTRLLFWLRRGEHVQVQGAVDSVADVFIDAVKGIGPASVSVWKWEYVFSELFEKRMTFERDRFMRGLARHLVARSAIPDADAVLAAMQTWIAKPEASRTLSLQGMHIVSALSHAVEQAPIAIPEAQAEPAADNRVASAAKSETAEAEKASTSVLRDRIMQAMQDGDATLLQTDWEISMREHPEILREALHRHARRADARQRLVTRFPDAMLLDMIWLLEPDAAECMAMLLDHPEPFTQAAGDDWQTTKRRLWDASFEYALNEQGMPDVRVYAERLLKAMAGRRTTLLQALVRAWNETLSDLKFADEARGDIASSDFVSPTQLPFLTPEAAKDEARELEVPASEADAATSGLSGAETHTPGRMADSTRAPHGAAKDIPQAAEALDEIRSSLPAASYLMRPATQEEEGSADSDQRSEAIVRGYDLYETLHRLLWESDEEVALKEEALSKEEIASKEEALLAAIGELAGRHGAQLRRFFRELRDMAPQALQAIPLTGAIWQRLMQVFIAQMLSSSEGDRQAFLVSIDEQANRAEDQAAYFRQILHDLLHELPLNLEAIVARSRTDSAGITSSGISREEAEAEQGARQEQKIEGAAPAETVPVSSPEEKILRAFMQSEAPLGIKEREALHHAVEVLLQKRAPALKIWFEQSPQTARRAVKLAQVLPERLLTRLLLWLRRGEHAQVQDAADSVADAFIDVAKEIAPVNVSAWKWEYVFGELFEKRQAFEREPFMQGLAQHLVAKSDIPNADTVRATVFRQALLQLRQLRPPAESKAATSPGRSSDTTKEAVRHEPVPYRAASEEDEPTENIYIRNAGQVLTAPYLPRLFTMLNMVEKGAFTSRETAERAAHLLQFMVNESTDSPEYQLVLNKLLCGVKTGVPIVGEIEITDTEKDAIEGLLKGVIQNWKTLGNTTIKGLRESFLQRDGWLRLKDDAWYLEVVPGTFDMLLDRLPWGFSVIKYPWMERPVHVTWR